MTLRFTGLCKARSKIGVPCFAEVIGFLSRRAPPICLPTAEWRNPRAVRLFPPRWDTRVACSLPWQPRTACHGCETRPPRQIPHAGISALRSAGAP
eukprot:scaffold764_cov248-Pinguiococcus_pyrenoidosus.AAC.14